MGGNPPEKPVMPPKLVTRMRCPESCEHVVLGRFLIAQFVGDLQQPRALHLGRCFWTRGPLCHVGVHA
jgi:hypothetical protein